MTPQEPIAFLRAHPPFDALEAAGVRAIEATLEVVYLPRGEVVLRRGGATGEHLYVVRKGAVRLERDGQVLQLLEEGDCFGFPSLIARGAPTADVVAAEDTLCYRLPGKVFDELMRDRRFADFFLMDLSQRVRAAAAPLPAPLASDLATPLERLVTTPALAAAPDEPVRAAARRMTEANVSSLVIAGSDGVPLGIVTDRDLRSRVVAAGLPAETPIERVMSRPVKTLPATATLFDAMVFMLEHDIQHVPLEAAGRIVAMVSSGDLLRLSAHDPLHLLHALRHGRGAPESYGRDLTAMVEALAFAGHEALQIARICSRLSDTLVALLLRRAEEELGPPPCAYAWIVFGSEGRMEQLLLTDQDNALVYERDSDGARAYFEALAGRVVDGLIRASFPPCPGGFMATRWTRTIAEMAALFAGWVARPEPEALVQAAAFFDFRAAFGTLDLAPLHEAVRGGGRGTVFLARLADEALRWPPPLGLFRQFRAEDGGVDLKKGGIQPVVGLARVCALEVGSAARPTVERLAAAAQAGTLSQEGAATLAEAFRFLLGLRLRSQLQALREGRPAGQTVEPPRLSPLERRHLKDTFLAIAQLQQSIGHRFELHRLG